MTEEATGGNSDAEPQQATVTPSRGVAEMIAALFGDYLANLTPIQESSQRCVWQVFSAHFGSLIWPTPSR
jgi:hypothetical protein